MHILKIKVEHLAYKKQRNVYVSILRKSKKCYHENLDTKNITDNKKFWGTVEPLFSNKVRSNTCITLNENKKLVKNEYQRTNIFNTFSIEAVPNLGTKVNERYLCDASNISDPIEKAIQKYKNHPSISIIKKMVSTVDKNNKFSFEPITADDISQQIKRLDINKATQESDIPTKLAKRFDNLIVNYLQENFSNYLKQGTSLKTLKRLLFIQPIKSTAKRKNQTIDQLEFCLIYLKFTNDFYMTKCILISVIFSLNINMAFVRDTVPNTAF